MLHRLWFKILVNFLRILSLQCQVKGSSKLRHKCTHPESIYTHTHHPCLLFYKEIAIEYRSWANNSSTKVTNEGGRNRVHMQMYVKIGVTHNKRYDISSNAGYKSAWKMPRT